MKGTFNIGASVWKFAPNNEICFDTDLNGYIDRGCEQIWLSENVYSREVTKQQSLSILYNKVVVVILGEFDRLYTTLDTDTFTKPFGDLLLQAVNTLDFDNNTLFGTFSLTHCKWEIKHRPVTMCAIKAVGRCTPELQTIELTKEGGTCTLTISKIEQTLWHEIIHAILYQMGQRDLYVDEHFVNLFSIFFRQFLTTLKIEDADKQNIKSK